MSQPNLNEDLNIVVNSNLTITYMDGNLDIIQQLDDEPNDVGGLTAAELKAKFDEAGNIIKTYINETLIPEILAADATEEARAAAEAQRETNEAQRIENENTRIAAEQSRASAETARDTAEKTREAAEQARADETSGIVARATEQANLASSAAASAGNSAEAAGLSATAASESASAAQESATSASQERAIATSAASQASSAASIASEQKSQAQAAASNAAQSAASASTSEANAKASETAAKTSETTAKSEADRAKSEADRAAGIVGDCATKTDLAAHTDDTGIHVTASEKAAWDAKADAPFKPEGKSYLTFSSPNSFTLAVRDATKHWDGTLEYFASDRTWTTWDGTTTLSSVDNYGEHVLYLRGTGNTKITGFGANGPTDTYKWVLTGTDIACVGNIENLLDYATVESGQHPTMAEACYMGMFYVCTALTQAPNLPATTLAGFCYSNMFSGCTALTKAHALPATTLADFCYYNMFRDCTSLTQAPALPAITLTDSCYYGMFRGCTSLTQAPALPATTLATECYRRMFYGCTSLKLSSTQTGEYMVEYRIPTTGTGTTATNALTDMFTATGGTFTGTPEVNTTYYLSSDNMVVRETEIATLNGYIKSMIDAAIANAIGG